MADATVGKLRVVITADTKGLKKGTRATKKKVSQLQKNINKELKKIDRAIAKTGRNFEKMARTTAKATAAITALIAASSLKMAKMASSAVELDNVLLQVFGSSGRQEMKEWSKELGERVGRANYLLNEMVGHFGAIFKAQGFTRGQTKKLSKSLTELAVDLGSLYEKRDEDVFRDLQAAMTGQVRAVRKYGISIEEAMLKEEAQRQGIDKSVKLMTQQEKIMLRYALIMQQTTTAQGDAERTIGTFANQLKLAKAQIDDLARTVGSLLLPSFTKVVTKLNDFLKAMKKIDFKEIANNENLQKLGKTIVGFTSLALSLGLVGQAIRLLRNPFFSILTLSGVIVAGMESNFLGLRDNIIDAFASVQKFFISMVNNIKDSDIFRFFKTSLMKRDIQSMINLLESRSGK